MKYGAGAAVATIVLLIAAGRLLLPAPAIDDTVGARLGYTLPWTALLGLPLVVAIAWVGNFRFFTPGAIEGVREGNTALDLHLRILQNTLEQTLLAALAQLGLCLLLPLAWLMLLPLWSQWFLVARAAFGIGYLRDPVKRAYGFAGTFYPTMFGYVALVVLLTRRASGL